jgi:hypothetical protein
MTMPSSRHAEIKQQEAVNTLTSANRVLQVSDFSIPSQYLSSKKEV